MRFDVYHPSPALKPYVRTYWVVEDDGPDQRPRPFRLFADSCPNLVFHYYNSFQPRGATAGQYFSDCHLSGGSDHFKDMTIRGSFGIFGVYFYPYAIPILFDLPTRELTEHEYALTDLLGAEGSRLSATIFNTPSDRGKIQVMEAFIEKRLRVDKGQEHMHGLCRHLIEQKGQLLIDHLVDQAGLSVRQFQRRFSSAAGMPPKLFAQILRFQHTLGFSGHSNMSLTEVGLFNGYFDQSHFIRDFRRFSGINPGRYFKPDAEHASSLIDLSKGG